MTDKENGRWGWQVKTGFRAWWIWVTANGGTFFNEAGTECVLNSPEAVEALQFLADLIHVHEVAPPLDVASELGSAELFQSGVTAMETWWPAIGRMRTNIGDKFEWNVAPHPAGKAGKSTSGGGTGHTVSAFTEHPDEAWEFLKFRHIDALCIRLDRYYGHRTAFDIGCGIGCLPQAGRATGRYTGLHQGQRLSEAGSAASSVYASAGRSRRASSSACGSVALRHRKFVTISLPRLIDCFNSPNRTQRLSQ